MRARRLIGCIPHLIVCALYIPLHNYGVDVYIEIYGGLTSRGIGIGMTPDLMVQYFVVMNAVTFFIPKLKLKVLFVSFMLALILYYFLPHYPVRAMAYTLMGGVLTFAAIFAGQLMDRLFFSKRKVEA
jgi:hypothetical protein